MTHSFISAGSVAVPHNSPHSMCKADIWGLREPYEETKFLTFIDGEVIGAVAAGGAKIEQDVKATKAALAALKL